MNTKQLQLLPWIACIYEAGHIPGPPTATTIPESRLGLARGSHAFVCDSMGTTPVSLEKMGSALRSKLHKLRQMDRYWNMVQYTFEHKVEEIIEKHVKAKMQDCLPDTGKHKEPAEATGFLRLFPLLFFFLE